MAVMKRGKVMKKNKCAKIGIAVSVLFLAYLIFFTNIILNHSCIGISVRNIGGALGTDLLVRYFDSEHAAKKFYKSIDVDNYYLTAIDADNSKNIKNSYEWFTSLEYPLVAENTKFVSIGSFESFVDENELMLYSKGEGLDDGYIDKDETDKSADLYDIGADYLDISENCTDEERNFYYSHCMYACSLKHAFHNYELSLESEDSFSERYWLFQLKDLCDNYQLPDIPNTERDEINWIEYNEQYISYINTIKNVVEKIESQEDFSNQEEAAIYAYWANVKIELHNKVNSDSIKVVSIKSFDNIIDTEYYTISVPQYWKAACVHEVIEKDNYNYTLNFYDRESKESGYGGWLFSISLLTEFEDYTEYPDYEILGSVEVYRIGTYNIVVTYPTDVQCSEDMMQQYSEMQECIPGILETISFKDECVFSSEPISKNPNEDTEYGMYSNAPTLAKGYTIIPSSFEIYGRMSLDKVSYVGTNGYIQFDPYRITLSIKPNEDNWFFIQKIYMDTLIFDEDGEIIKNYHNEYDGHNIQENFDVIEILGFDNLYPPNPKYSIKILENWDDFPENAYSAAILLSFDVFAKTEYGAWSPDYDVTVPAYEIRYIEPQVFISVIDINDGRLFGYH